MRYLTLGEVVALHRRLIATTGESSGIRDLGRLESALAQPRASFSGEDLYPGVIEKAAALGFSLVMGAPRLQCRTLPKSDWNALWLVSCSALLDGALPRGLERDEQDGPEGSS
jgi:hypothetical protein